MYRIKLLILLLTSFFIFSCANNIYTKHKNKFSISYVEGGYNSLLLTNILKSHLSTLNIYDKNSEYEIRPSINHEDEIYITNIDNTSEREKITTTLSVKIYNQKNDCNIYSRVFEVAQFYIFSSGDKFLSNSMAVKKIKKNNTEAVIKKLINELPEIEIICK